MFDKAFILAAAAALALAPISARADGTKAAVVDLQKVFNGYYKTTRSSQSLKREAEDMQKERNELLETGKKAEAEWQKLLDKSEDQSLSPEERAKSKKAASDKLREVKADEEQIQSFERASTTKLREKERQRHDDIVKEIRGVLNSMAKTGGYNLVFDTSGESANTVPVVLFNSGLDDLTDRLLKELNVGATPESSAPANSAK